MSTTDTLIDRLAEGLQPVKPLRKPWQRAILWSAFATAVIAAIGAVGGSRAALAEALPETGFLLPLIGSWLTGMTAAVAAFQVSLPDRSPRWLWLPVAPVLLWNTGFAYGCLANFGAVPESLAQVSTSDCLLTIVLTSVALSAVLLPMLRRVRTLRPRLTALLGFLAVAGFADTAHLLVHTEQDSILALTVNLVPATITVLLAGLVGRRAVGT